MKTKSQVLLMLGVFALMQLGCAKVNFGGSSGDSGSSQGGAVIDGNTGVTAPVEPPETFDGSSQICDPFSTPGQQIAGKGFIGSLHYAPSGDGIRFMRDLLARATRSQYAIVFSKLDVPTRSFEDGFLYNGSALTDDSGRKLIEWFGLRLQTDLTLPASYSTGYYQFRVYSDDGSILMYDNNGTTTTLINHDGHHPSSAKCSDKALLFNSGTKTRIYLDYFQGPRVEIALRLMWRKVSSATPTTSDCTSDAGWQVVPAEALNLPPNIVNQCK